MRERLQLCYVCHARSRLGVKPYFCEIVPCRLLRCNSGRSAAAYMATSHPDTLSHRVLKTGHGPPHCALCLKPGPFAVPRSRIRLPSTDLGIKPIEGPSFSELPRTKPLAPGPRAPAAWNRVQVTGASIGHGYRNEMGGPLTSLASHT